MIPKVGDVWVTPPDQLDYPEGERIGYLIHVPSYYEAIEFRDRFAREFGVEPSAGELLNAIAGAIEALEPDASRHEADGMIMLRAVMALEDPGILDVEGRRRLGILRERARRMWEPFRMMEAAAASIDEYRLVETVREWLRDWRSLPDAAGGEVAFPGLDAEGRAPREVFDMIPSAHVQWLYREIFRRGRPTGQPRKNSQSRSSPASTPTPSKTAAGSPSATPRPKARSGSSKTSGSRQAARPH